MDGLWIARFSTPLNFGGGVAYFNDGRIYGGDSGYTYIGHFSTDGEALHADVSVNP